MRTMYCAVPDKHRLTDLQTYQEYSASAAGKKTRVEILVMRVCGVIDLPAPRILSTPEWTTRGRLDDCTASGTEA